MQQERAGRQEQRAGDLQNILDAVKAKIRDLEDDFICKMRQQQGEVTSLLTEKEAAQVSSGGAPPVGATTETGWGDKSPELGWSRGLRGPVIGAGCSSGY